jgi:hypothetical protein
MARTRKEEQKARKTREKRAKTCQKQPKISDLLESMPPVFKDLCQYAANLKKRIETCGQPSI